MKKTSILWLLITAFSLGTHFFSENKEKELDLDHVYAIPASYDNAIEDEPSYASQSYLQFLNIGNTWNETRGENVTIAIIDSGINYLHEDFYDLNGNSIISNASAVYTSSGIVKVKDKNYDYSILNDTNGHGTNVAGVIASQINKKGCVGIAPNVNLMILKTSDYSFTSINALLRYAANEKADIINMSFTAFENTVEYNGSKFEGVGSQARTSMVAAINYAYQRGSTLVAAGGNFNTSEKAYPANLEHVIAVGSLAKNSYNQKAGFSNIGTNVDLVAPGYVYVPDKGGTSAYKNTQGTSFSTPMVASALALYKSKYPKTKNHFMMDKLLNSCADLNDEDQFGKGRLDISAFLNDAHIDVTGLEVPTKEFHLKVGEKDKITANVLPKNATNQEIVFLNYNDDIVSVDDEGNIEALKEGEALVEVYANESDQCEEVTIIVDDKSIVYTPTEIPTETKTESAWELVNDASTLKAGDQLVLVENTNNKIASTISGSFLTAGNIQLSKDKKTITEMNENALILTLGEKDGAWTLTNEDEKLLGATGAQIVSLGNNNAINTWTIAIESNGKATVTNTKTNNGRFLYNVGNPRFTTYTSIVSTSMLLIQLYRLNETTTITYTEVGQLMKDIQETDFCEDYSLANTYLERYAQLSAEDKAFFEKAIISTEGTTYLERLYFFSNKAKTKQLTSYNFLKNNHMSYQVILGIVGLGVLSIFAYAYVLKKKKYQ